MLKIGQPASAKPDDQAPTSEDSSKPVYGKQLSVNDLFEGRLWLTTVSTLNRVCRPGGHYWDHYPGALSLCDVIATPLKIGHSQ